MEFLLFEELLIILVLSIFVLLIGSKLRIPAVVGFIITGVLAGPHGFKLVHDVDDVDRLAQIGIVLLLFGIGMEFSYQKLIQIRRLFLLGGSLQVGLTFLATLILGYFLGLPLTKSIFLGFLLSMSSTAIVLRILEQQGSTASPHGRVSISMLIFQDLVAIPMILFTPILGNGEGHPSINAHSIQLFLSGLITLGVVFYSAQKFVPRLLLQVARTRNKELFLLTVLALCFGVAWLTSNLGLSLTIGAFLAGLIISESEFSNEAISHIFPFQALFISVFFISVGMLLNINFVIHQPITITLLALGILLLKTLTGALATILLGMPIRTALLVGIALSQIGEFSFVLAKTGIAHGLGTDYDYQLFLAVSLLTLMISPILLSYSSTIANWIMKLPLPEKLKTGFKLQPKEELNELKNHIVILGFGVSGKNLARSSKLADIPYVILEMNPDTVKEYRKKGEPIHFGDATHLPVLEHMKIHEARVLAVLVNDPIAAHGIVKMVREANPSIYIIVRARYVQEMGLFDKLGANEVVPDEFGTSIEIFSRVLKHYYVPQDEIEHFTNVIRSDGYQQLKEQQIVSKSINMKLNLEDIYVQSFRVQNTSSLVGKSLVESQLRKSFGLTVLIIKREDQIITNPPPDTILQANDILVVVGDTVANPQVRSIFNQSEIILSPA